MNQERVLKFLASGLTETQVASIVGVTPARIFQLKAEEGFKQRLLEEQAQAEEKTGEEAEDEILTGKYLAVEHSLLKQMESQIPYSELRDCTNALKVITDRQHQRQTRKLQQRALEQYRGANLTLVSITLPSHAVPKPEIQLNEQQEIVAIDKIPMAPLSSDAVRALFQTRKLRHTETQENSNLIIEAGTQMPADF